MPHLTNPLHHQDKGAAQLGAQQQQAPMGGPETSSLNQQGTLVDGAHPQHHHQKGTGAASGFFEGYSTKGWFGQQWVDLLTMAIVGAIALGVYVAPPAPSRSFAINFQDGESE